MPMYKSIFLDSTSRYADTYGIEPGFLILNKVLRIFGVSADFAIAFFRLPRYGLFLNPYCTTQIS